MIIRVLSRFSKEISVNVVVGPTFNNLELIESAVYQGDLSCKIFQNPENIGELMYDSDLAISGGGGTLYELAATGTPAIALCQAENQILHAESLEQFGSIINIGDGTMVDEKTIEHNLVRLMENPDIVRSMSIKCKELVDGNGATRVVETIMKSLES
jgi:spore coat polysaccharide biosynthesis predicted glycosyltransferase SpsG